MTTEHAEETHATLALLLRSARLRWQAITGLLAQVTQGAAAIGIILVVREHSGSLALAGGVVGILSVAAGVARPVQGRLIDRRGSRNVLIVCGIVHGLALGGIVGFSAVHAPGAVLVLLGCLAGFALPPVSTTMRVEWARLTEDGDRTAAYSLVYLTQVLSVLAGPLILSAIVAAGSASLALCSVAGVAAAGSIGFAVTLPHARDHRPAPTTRAGSVLRVRGIQLVMAVTLCVGAVIGALDVAAPTLATAHGKPAVAGLLIACLSIGGVLGATVYGGRQWQSMPARRLIVTLPILTVALVALVIAHGLVIAGALLFLAGIPLNPTLTTFSLLVDRHVGGRAAGEAFGWLSTALAGGQGVASAIAGIVAQQQHDARAAFVIAAIAGGSALAVCLLARGPLARVETRGGGGRPAGGATG